MYGSEERGFDPGMTRHHRNRKQRQFEAGANAPIPSVSTGQKTFFRPIFSPERPIFTSEYFLNRLDILSLMVGSKNIFGEGVEI